MNCSFRYYKKFKKVNKHWFIFLCSIVYSRDFIYGLFTQVSIVSWVKLVAKQSCFYTSTIFRKVQVRYARTILYKKQKLIIPKYNYFRVLVLSMCFFEFWFCRCVFGFGFLLTLSMCFFEFWFCRCVFNNYTCPWRFLVFGFVDLRLLL